MSDDFAEIRAELKRRGALPESNGTRTVTSPSGGSDAYLVILAEAVNHLAKSVSEMRAATAQQAADFLAAQANVKPRVRRIERNEAGEITAIVEEDL